MPRHIGIQLYTLGDINADVAGALRSVAEIGFREVELPSLYGQSGAALRQAIDAAGLTCPSIHVQAEARAPGDLSLADVPRVVAEAHALGARYITVPIFPFRFTSPPAAGESMGDILGRLARNTDWAQLADLMNAKGALLARENLKLAYHNHNLEFISLGEQTALEFLLARTDPALVAFELDVGWVAAAGVDPAQFIERYPDRIHMLHMKDLTQTAANTALQMNPTEVGSGVIDWPRVLAAARAAGVRHYFLEQEPPFAHPRLESARIGYQFLDQAMRG